MRYLKNLFHFLSGCLAVVYYRFPARHLTVIGITGTDGKTTTTSIVYHIFTKAGLKTALITSVGAKINGKDYDNGFHVTTPGSWLLQKYLRQAVSAGVTHVALEVSSHSLDQHRIVGIPFRAAAITNITHEHLDYHTTYERYVAAKAKLLRRARVAIVNRDDESYAALAIKLRNQRVIRYGLQHPDTELNPLTFPFTTKLLGEFNRYNALAAIGIAQEIGIDEEIIRDALLSFTPPEGRQKIVYDKDFKIIIDFAHTPNAFMNILKAVRPITSGRLIHVFGSAGLRDRAKRPIMGEASERYADIIILTAEDPRGESVATINHDIAQGIKKFVKKDEQTIGNHEKNIWFSIPNRTHAIEFAIKNALPNDTVLLTGKSHEKSMNYDGSHEEPWDETHTALAALHQRVVDVQKNILTYAKTIHTK